MTNYPEMIIKLVRSNVFSDEELIKMIKKIMDKNQKIIYRDRDDDYIPIQPYQPLYPDTTPNPFPPFEKFWC